MKGSLIIITFFILGILLSYLGILPQFLLESTLSTYTLYLLLFFVGITVGSDSESIRIIRDSGWKIFLVPIGTVLGTAFGLSILFLFFKTYTYFELMSLGAGYGYYSLSSILITQVKGQELGVIALLVNILREIVTLLFTPLFAKYFGKLAPISSGGATSMDTSLALITKFVGKEYALVSVVHGTILTILVPFIVSFFLRF